MFYRTECDAYTDTNLHYDNKERKVGLCYKAATHVDRQRQYTLCSPKRERPPPKHFAITRENLHRFK